MLAERPSLWRRWLLPDALLPLLLPLPLLRFVPSDGGVCDGDGGTGKGGGGGE